MKRIVEEKMYDTETAKKIACFSAGNDGDCHSVQETLYCSNKGQLFLAYSGGALSEYGESLCGGNGCTGTEGIVLYDEKNALEWIERRGIDTDTISDAFEIEEG